MFYYIQGNLEGVGEDYVIIDNNGIGYKIYTSGLSIEEFKKKETDIKAYTEIILRDDSISVYGFSKFQELQLFQMLTSVTGIGAKVALGVLSSIPMHRLADIILSGDIPSLMKAQGVGKKIAQRIVLELKDKIDLNSMTTKDIRALSENATELSDTVFEEAVQALVGLGYIRSEAAAAVRKTENCTDIEQVIKYALKHLAK